MDFKIFFAILFIGLAGNALSLPNQCRFILRQRKLECKLARLFKTIGSLNIPWEAKIVSLQNNELTNAQQVAEKISGLRYLVTLDLSYNNIANGLRDLVSQNLNLEDFRIRNNLLRSIHEQVFQNNRRLEKVDLSNNRLSTLPRRLFRSNPQLRTVLLWANDLTTLPEDLFRSNKEIEVINLSWNKLTDIPETFFRGLTNLKKVIIWKNQLTCLYSSMFQDNTLLTTFHAAINYIKKVPDQIFDSNPELEDVRFWSNRLECIPRNIFLKNGKIGYVNLLLGNEKLPWVLKQRFSKTGTHNVFKMANELYTHGNQSCTAAPCEWNPETLTMDCSHRGLTDLAGLQEVCEKVRNLDLDGNFLNDPGILPEVMDNMRELRSITAKGNEMKGPIPGNLFSNNLQLASVDLSQNELTEIPEVTFEANPILKSVSFADNEIEEIPGNLFTNNPELRQFDASRNKLKELSKTVFSSNRMMTAARFSKNKISHIDVDTFKNTEKLTELDLSENNLEGEIYMDAFENAPNLESVLLQGNRLTHIRKGRLPLMVLNRTLTLELSYNKLEELPVDLIQERPNLRRLILDHNRIASIPEGALYQNKELVEIDLSYNRLGKLSNNTFSRNVKLEILRLDHNALTRLDEGLLHANPYLRYFSASGNKIHYVSPNLFLFNIHLQEVSFSDNLIAKLPEELFHPLGESLRFLVMSKNFLDYLPPRSFVTNDQLEQLYLNGNSLSKIPKEPIRMPENQESEDGTPPDGGVSDALLEALRPGRESHEYTYVTKDEVQGFLNRLLTAGPLIEEE